MSTTVPSSTQATASTTIQEKHAPITTQIVPDDKHESFAPDELPVKSQSAKPSISDVASSVPIITETLLTEELGTQQDIPSHTIETVTETVVDDTTPRHTVKQSSVEISEVEEETVIKPKKEGKRDDARIAAEALWAAFTNTFITQNAKNKNNTAQKRFICSENLQIKTNNN